MKFSTGKIKSQVYGFEFTKFCLKKKRLLILVIAISVGISMMSFVFGSRKAVSIRGSRDNLSGITLNSNNEGEEIRVSATNGSDKASKTVYLKAVKNKKNSKKDKAVDKSLELKLSDIIRKLKNNTKANKMISLPKQLDDGTRLNWSIRSKQTNYAIVMAAAPLVMLFAYRSEKDKEKKEAQRKRNDIIRNLPAFGTKLELFLNCGMVYEDAMSKVIDGYSKEFPNELSKLISDAKELAMISGRDEMEILGEKSRSLKIKELTRITAMIADSKYKGTELGEKLSREGEYLWQRRIKTAEENAKLAELKLSLPLALQLLSLIIITAAPAVIQF